MNRQKIRFYLWNEGDPSVGISGDHATVELDKYPFLPANDPDGNWKRNAIYDLTQAFQGFWGFETYIQEASDLEQWTQEWPQEEGVYWFYGHVSEASRNYDPMMHLVHIIDTRGGITAIAEGRCIYKIDGANGYWIRANLPDPPEKKHERID